MIGIEKKDFDKIIDFAKASVKEFDGAEIGGMAILQMDEDKDWIIKHPTILKQEVASSTCTLEKEALANYYTKAMMKHGTDLKFVWWHSHGTGSTFWSATDETAIKEFKGGNWSVSLVVNADAEYTLRVDYWKPVPAKLDELELHILGEKEYTVPTSIINQVKKLCTKETYTVTKYNKKQMTLLNGKTTNNHYGYGYGYGVGYGDDSYTSPGNDWDPKYNGLKTKFNWWQKKSIDTLQEEFEAYTDGHLTYPDFKGLVDDVNTEIVPYGRIWIPKEKRLHKLVEKKANVDILKFFKEA